MNIVILAAGSSPKTLEDNYPACLAEINGIPLLQLLVNEVSNLQPDKILFAFQQSEIIKFHLNHVAERLTDKAKVFGVGNGTQGAACTVLLTTSFINNDQELLVVNANELVLANLLTIVQSFRARNLAAGTVTFPSVHPRYSYVRVDKEGLVTEAAEKNPISDEATGGVYWFSKGALFLKSAMSMIRKDARVNGNFYICPVLNEIILNDLDVGVYPIEADQYIPLKNERQFDAYETHAEWKK